MLKDKNKLLLKMGSLVSLFMLVLGIILCTVGYSMENNIEYLKTDKHQWYRIVYANEDNELHFGLSFDDIGVFGHVEIPLD
ncbi:MAG: hypothetical protein ACLUVC_08600 [Longibaculum sp.]